MCIKFPSVGVHFDFMLESVKFALNLGNVCKQYKAGIIGCSRKRSSGLIRSYSGLW